MSEPLSSPVGNSEREYYADEMNKGWKARAEKVEAELHLAQLEIAARKQECQTVTRKRDKAEAEATRYREALEQAYRDFDELSGAMEGDYDFAGIRNSASIFKAQARAALGKEGV